MSDAALGLRILRPDSLIITLTVLSARHGAGVGTCVKSPGTIDKPPTDASSRWLMQVLEMWGLLGAARLTWPEAAAGMKLRGGCRRGLMLAMK